MRTRRRKTSSALPWGALLAFLAAFVVATLALGRVPGTVVGGAGADARARIGVSSLATSVRYAVTASAAEPRTRPAPAAEDAPLSPDEAIHASPARLSVSAARASSAPPRVMGASVLPLARPSMRAHADRAWTHLRPVGRVARRSTSPARTRAALMVFLN